MPSPTRVRAGEPGQALDQRLIEPVGRVDAFDRHADLAGVEEGAAEQVGRDLVEIGVVQNNRRVVAAELQRHALERSAGARHHPLAGRDRAGERDAVDAGMLGHPAAQRIAAGHGVEHARRQGGARHLAHQKGRQRRIGRGLQHHRVAGIEAVRDLVGRQDDREIPRRDRRDDAERMIDQLDPVLAVVADDLGLDLELAHGFELMGGAADLPFRLAQRLALLARQDRADLVDACGKSVCEIGDRLAALCEAFAAPRTEGRTGCSNCAVELLARCIGAFGERLAGRRIDDVEALFAALGLAVDGVRVLVRHVVPPLSAYAARLRSDTSMMVASEESPAAQPWNKP